MSDQEQQAELKALIDAAPGLFQANMAFLATTVWFFWDWMISIDQEVEHFWGKRVTTGTVLYFLNRLVGLFISLIHFQTSVRPLSLEGTNRLCEPFVVLILVFNGVSGLVVQTVLVLRTYALWDGNKFVLWFLMATSIIAVLVQEAFVGLELNYVTIFYNPLPAPYTGCLPVFPRWVWQRYLPIIAFEIIAASFMLVKFLQFMREGSINRVLYVIFRDGFLEFIALTVTTIFSLFVGIFKLDGSTSADIVTFDLASSFSLICCARMLLNIRDIMTLSGPADTTKSDPWSLGASFDIYYGLGGVDKVALESNLDSPGLFGQLVHTDPTRGPPSSSRMATSSLPGLGASSERSRGKVKVRDEEPGVDAEPQDPATEMGFQDATTSVPPDAYRSGPSEPSSLLFSSNQYQSRDQVGFSRRSSRFVFDPDAIARTIWAHEDLERKTPSGQLGAMEDP